jgi:hypothetical protein
MKEGDKFAVIAGELVSMYGNSAALRGYPDMTRSLYVIAILAAAISTSAVAKDLKQDQKTTASAPGVSAAQMSDSEMDKVTAGVAADPTPWGGLSTAGSVDANLGQSFHVPDGKGLGTATIPGQP